MERCTILWIERISIAKTKLALSGSIDLMHFQPNLSTAFIDTDKLILIGTWKGKATTRNQGNF